MEVAIPNVIDIVIDLCDIDLDFYIYDFNFIDIGNTDANLDVCLEHMSISNLPNGTYFLVSHIYHNPHSSFGVLNLIPLTVTYSQDLVINETLFIDNNITLSTSDNSIVIIAEIEIINDAIYTITPQ